MKYYYSFLAIILTCIISCAQEVEEKTFSSKEQSTFYLNTGSEIIPFKNAQSFLGEKFPSELQKTKSLANTNFVAPSPTVRSNSEGTNPRTVIAYGYKSIEKEKIRLYVFPDSIRKEMGLPPGYYMMTIHKVKQIFSCKPGLEITPFPQYTSTSYKEKIGFEHKYTNDRGFSTNIGNRMTSGKTFEGTTILYYFHSDVLGRRGYKNWYPCAPEDLVWIYREFDRKYDWGIE